MARHGEARRGSAWLGKAWRGSARQGVARQGAARQGMARQGKAWRGQARLGTARPGKAWQGSARLGKAIKTKRWLKLTQEYDVEGVLRYDGEDTTPRGAVHFWVIGEQKFSTWDRDQHLSSYEGLNVKTRLEKHGAHFNYKGAAINPVANPISQPPTTAPTAAVPNLDEYRIDYLKCLKAAVAVAAQVEFDQTILLSPRDVKDIATTFFIQARREMRKK
jgi:hypothetical protein